MISSIYRLEPSLSVRVAQEKAPEEEKAPEQEQAPGRESPTFYIVTGILVVFAALLAVLSVVAVAVVFSGGMS